MSKKILLFPAAVILLVIVFFKSELFSARVSEIILHDTFCLDQSQVKQELAVEGTNILLIKESAARKILMDKFFCVGDLKIEKQLPRTIKIEVFGRQPYLKLMNFQARSSLDLGQIESSPSSTSALLNWDFPAQEGTRFIIDRQGVVFKEENISGLPLIFVTDGLKLGYKYEANIFQNIQQVIDGLGSNYQVLEGKIVGENLMVKTPQKVVFSLKKRASAQLASLQLILQKAKMNGETMELIDLRFDKPIVIYNPKK